MARIWLDFMTPKDVLFLGKIGEELEKQGLQVVRTSRRYKELNMLLRHHQLSTQTVGQHGGATLTGKLKAFAERVTQLTTYVTRWNPDAAVSFSSPEAATVAHHLGVPHICISDSPHATAVCKLTIPLSDMLLTPAIIPDESWGSYGISKQNIRKYNALDAVAWIKSVRRNKKVLRAFRLRCDDPIVVARPEEAFASYLLDITTYDRTPIIPILRHLIHRFPAAQFVVIPRYSVQRTMLHRTLGQKVKVTRKAMDASTLIAHATLFIGAGGTMTQEAALLGVPTISVYPGEPTLVEQFLIKKELVCRVTPDEAAKLALEILLEPQDHLMKQRAAATEVVNSMEDPAAAAARHITDFMSSRMGS